MSFASDKGARSTFPRLLVSHCRVSKSEFVCRTGKNGRKEKLNENKCGNGRVLCEARANPCASSSNRYNDLNGSDDCECSAAQAQPALMY